MHGTDSLMVIVGLTNNMPDAIDNVAGSGNITLTGLDLEVVLP